ncbi:MAG TPA: YDG domain-containing protein [Gemmataceae bacterium]|jgi:filamentous hemagglutinin family protein|nr:YDG domain-containing protein [Gemmataceae bacterium]
MVLKRLVAFLAILALLSNQVLANPVGGTVLSGNATISTSGSKLTVNQSSDKALIDWRKFDIAPAETTQFKQPASTSLTVNRINDSGPSKIEGNLQANGNLVLINQNGILFTKDSKIDVAGIVATSSNLNETQFKNGKLVFDKPGQADAKITNEGAITTKDAGLVGLVAPQVENRGIIRAKYGKVNLASGDAYTLDLAGDGLIQLAVTGKVKDQLAGNSGLIEAKGGEVYLTAAAARDVVSSMVANSGTISATADGTKTGKVRLFAEGSNAVEGNQAQDKGKKQGESYALNSGTIDVSGKAPGEKGGKARVLADNVGLLNGSVIDASGDQGGGDVRVGGNYLGTGYTPAAKNTFVDSASLIQNDAITSGDGGRTIVWSDGNTYFYGSIYGRGGKQSGNGGFTETSGHGYLDAQGFIDLTAQNDAGNKGTYLLDPTDVTIYGNSSSAFNSAMTAYWSFDEGAGTNAGDSTANGNTGTLANGPAWSTDTAPTPQQNSYSLSFDGNDDKINLAGTATGSTFTYSTWFKPTAQSDSYGTLLGSGSAGFWYRGTAAGANAGKVTYYYSGDHHTTATAVDGQWNLFVASVNSGSVTFYLNGVAAGTSASGAAFTGIAIGDDSGSETFKGKLDDMRLFSVALTANDVAELYGSRFTVAGIQKMSQTADVSVQASNNITLDFGGDTLTTTAGRNLTLNAGNQITTASAGTINTSPSAGSGGNISLTGTNGIVLNHAYTMNTGGGNLTFNNPVTLGASQTWNVGSGTLTTAGTVNGGYNLTATAGTMSFGGRIGGTTPLSAVSLTSTNALSLPTINASSISAITSAGTITGTGGIITSGGAIDLSASSDLDLSGAGIASNNGNVTLGGRDVTLNTSVNTGTGNLTVNASRDIFLTSNNLTNGLVGYWKFDEGSGTSAADTSGQGHTGTLTNGPTWSSTTPFGTGYSLSFNGTNSFVDTPNGFSPIKGDDTHTISLWFNVPSNPGIGVILDAYQTSNALGGFLEFNGLNGFYWGYAGAYRTYTGMSIATNAWNNITVVKTGSGDSGNLYLNGVLQSTYSGSLGSVPNENSNLYTGRYRAAGYYLNSSLDDIRIYNTALSAGDISKLYSAPQVSWNTGTTSLTATRNVSLDLKGETMTLGAGKNLSVTAGGSVSSASTGTIAASRNAGSGGNISMTAGGSSSVGVSNLALNSTGGAVSLTSPGAMTLGNITAGTIAAQTTGAASDLTIASGKTLTASASGDAITLASGRNFINSAGSSALSAASGRWLVYSTNPASDTIGSLANNFRRFSCTYGGSCPSLGTGNGFLYTYTPTLTATPGVTKTYGDSADLTGYAYTLSGYLGSDASADSIGGSLNGVTAYSQFADVGSYNIDYTSGALTSAMGYGFSYANNATGLTVTKKSLTPGLTGTVSKAYDGTTAATLAANNYTLTGVVNSDDVAVSTTAGTYDTKNLGTGKNVSVAGMTLGGAKAGNYQLSSNTVSGNAGTITAKNLTVTGVTANNKIYDGTTSAVLDTLSAALSGVIGGETVTLGTGSASGTFANKNVGTGKPITVTGLTIGGADSGNYTLSQPSSVTADITAKALSILGVTAANKIYDGTTTASLNTAGDSLSGVVAGDTVSLSNVGAAGTFANKNVGTNKAVTASGFSISGADSGNYALSQPAGLAADITAKGLTIAGVTANNKTYDGTTAATLNTAGDSLSGVVAGDTVSLNNAGATGTFANQNAGAGKPVTASGFLIGGADSGNYSLAQPAGLTADITKKSLDAALSDKSISNGALTPTLDATDPADVTWTGFIGGEDTAQLSSVTFSYGGATPGVADAAGTYALDVAALTATNYQLGTTTAGTLTIAAAPAGGGGSSSGGGTPPVVTPEPPQVTPPTSEPPVIPTPPDTGPSVELPPSVLQAVVTPQAPSLGGQAGPLTSVSWVVTKEGMTAVPEAANQNEPEPAKPDNGNKGPSDCLNGQSSNDGEPCSAGASR